MSVSRREAARAPTVAVPQGGRFEGLLCFWGRAGIEGELVGEIVARGRLDLAESARVEANIEVDELVIAGQLEGDAVARRRIEVRPSAQVRGDLRSPTLALSDGCSVQGRCLAGPIPEELLSPDPGSTGSP